MQLWRSLVPEAACLSMASAGPVRFLCLQLASSVCRACPLPALRIGCQGMLRQQCAVAAWPSLSLRQVPASQATLAPAAARVCREACLRGQDAALGGGLVPRSSAALPGLEAAGGYFDTHTTRMLGGTLFNASGTLDEWLLDHWYGGTSAFDGLFVDSLSAAGQVRGSTVTACCLVTGLCWGAPASRTLMSALSPGRTSA